MNNIDILKEKIKNVEKYDTYNYTWTEQDIQAISTLIAENKELKEENLHWKGQYHLLSRKIDVIPKSKVEEILKKYKYTEIEDSEKIIQFYKDLQSLLGKE